MFNQGRRSSYAKSSPNSSSTTNLIPPSARGPPSSPSSARTSPGTTPVSPRPNFANGPPSLRSVSSQSSLLESPYNVGPARNTPSVVPSISDKYSLSADPISWGTNIHANVPEPDDFLHNPDPKRDYKNDRSRNIFTGRGLANLGCLIFLGVGLLTLFAGYPLITYFTTKKVSLNGAYNYGGINATGQVPVMAGKFALVDAATPTSAYTHKSYNDPNTEWQLVFSDEFNTPGRSFYPGDDPYWEAVDLHYWATGNLEWYNPDAITTTEDGHLQILFEEKPNHGLNYSGGMMSTWNKFCFTGGLVVASVQLPGQNNVAGYWPAIWTMGNLGRAGYGATLDGMWPYSYDSCDVGTAPNQTYQGRPLAALTEGDPGVNGTLSYLPGQRLSRCTCPGESHPGPVHSDGTYVGRSSPEIDMFEAQVQYNIGAVSQSSQWAPFNANYAWYNTSANLVIPDPTTSVLNQYQGAVYQQAASVVTTTNVFCYQLSPDPCFAIYGFEYTPGFDNAYISWIANDKLAWTLNAPGMAADSAVEIGPRPISQEPMYLIVNLGMSPGFGYIDFDALVFPATMLVDYIRVYQPKNAINIGCDPQDFPTAAYINEYIEAYTNPNLTTWTGVPSTGGYNQVFPKNSFINGGSC